MGIVLHAIVEFQVVLENRSYWENIAEFQLNKHPFRLALALVENPKVHSRWPEDVSIERWEREEKCIECGLRCCDLPTLAAIVERGQRGWDPTNSEEGPFLGTPAAIVAFMRSFENEGIATRILFYES